LTIGVPISIALSKPVITPDENVFHPIPITAKMTTINKIKRLRYYQPIGKQVYVPYYGDYDPSGLSMVKKLEEALKRIDIHFLHVAITKEQIEMFGLQGLTNPDPSVRAKLEKDPNTESFRLENNGKLFQIELDALSALRPDKFRDLLEKSVDEHFDADIYHRAISDPKHSATHIRRLVHKGIKEFKQISNSKRKL